MRALVVGGTGFVGSAVVRAFDERGIDVVSLSRSGDAFVGRGVTGDVCGHNLGIEPSVADELRESVTHVVSCFGSVDWNSGPRLASELHHSGTRAVMRFAESCPSLERFVHLSSILALGRASGTITDELELGQSFRNWYEYGKYLAEREVRANDRIPWRVLRVGPVMGVGRDVAPDSSHGILSVVPFLVRGYPMHLADHGEFPCYPGDVAGAGEVLARAALDDGDGEVWTWFDSAMPSLAGVLEGLCSAWGVIPKIVDVPALMPLGRLTVGRVGLPRELLDYADPWAEIPVEVLARLPGDLPGCRPGYVEATGAAINRSHLALSAA